jgi:hypothetical protein
VALVDQEIARLRAIDDERERAHKKKMKGRLFSTSFSKYRCFFFKLGFLNKAEKKGEALFNDVDSTTIKSGFIEEVKE